MKAELSYVHRFIPGADRTTLLLLHGTGGDEGDMLPLGRTISLGSPILSPRGKVLENGMPRFFRRIREDVLDLHDLKYRSGELSEFVREASTEYGFKLDSTVAVGYSNGANIAASILLLGLLPLSGAILFRPMAPLVPDQLPDLNGVPIFVSAGTNDPLIPGEETSRLANLLQRTGAEVVLNWESAGHGVGEGEVERARGWFQTRFVASARAQDARP